MKEILGCDLNKFFNVVDPDCKRTDIKYAGATCEVWEIDDELYKEMTEMTEPVFLELAGTDTAWWRGRGRCVLGAPNTKAIINGRHIICWDEEYISDNENDEQLYHTYDSLLEYLKSIGVYTPMNIYACAADLAKYNNLTLSKLFRIYEC